MKVLQYVTAAVAAAFLVAALFLTSIQLAVYGDREYRFYEREYEKYQVADSLGMEMPDIMDVTEKMMAYLIGEREELSVVTWVDGRRQDFFHEQDRFHMGEVRELFFGGLRLRNYFLAAAGILLVLLAAWKTDLGRVLPRAYALALSLYAACTAALGGLLASDFNKYFTIFHEIFFDNDLWIFDPAEDYMIRMLPEGFFFDFAMRIGAFFIGGLLLLSALAAGWAFYEKWKKGKGAERISADSL